MVGSLQRERWTALRYYYYHAGRSLVMNGNLYAGGINIGYAIEFSMKTGLREVLAEEEWEKNTILTKEHDIIKIFSECQAKHMFNEDVKISRIFRECQAKNVFNKAIDVSRDLLEQININFQRYPSQIDKKFEENFGPTMVILKIAIT